MDSIKSSEIIDYWYSDGVRKHWFSSTPELDKEIRDKYQQLWLEAASGALDAWQESPESCLALVILLDQFPLNMFRGRPESFQTDRKAVEVTLEALGKGFGERLNGDKLSFLLMPLMHSERIEEQDLSVQLYSKHGLTNNLKFAEHHRDIIRRFGRFPHRNSILGRANTPAEDEYLRSDKAFKG